MVIRDEFGIFFSKRPKIETELDKVPVHALVSKLFAIGRPGRYCSPSFYFSLEDAADIPAIGIHQIQVPRALAIRDEQNLLTRRRPGCLKIMGGMLREIHLFGAIRIHHVDFVIAIPPGGKQDFRCRRHFG